MGAGGGSRGVGRDTTGGGGGCGGRSGGRKTAGWGGLGGRGLCILLTTIVGLDATDTGFLVGLFTATTIVEGGLLRGFFVVS